MRTLFSLAVVLVASGCVDEAVGPPAVIGQYRLTSVDGRSLPLLQFATTNCDNWLVGGALSLLPDNAFLLGSRDSLDCSRAGAPPTVSWSASAGSFTLQDGRLTLVPDGQVNGARYVGTVQGEVILVTFVTDQVSIPERPVSRYERLP